MEINQNQTNLSPVDSKSPGFSALKKAEESRVKDNVVEFTEAEKLIEAKKVKDELEKDVQLEKDVKTEAGDEKLSSVIQSINKRVQSLQRDLVFSVDEDTGKDVVTIMDSKNKKVIKQIPSEEMLELARNLNEQLDEDNPATKVANLFSSIA